MSGAQSTLIAVGALTLLSAWVLYVLRPWRHPQHAAQYRPDPLEVAAVTETVPDWPNWVDRTVPYAEVEGAPPWDIEVEASMRAELGELVFGDSLGWQSGGCLDEAALREELARVLARVNAVPVANRIIDVLRELESSGPPGQGTPEGDPGLPASGTEQVTTAGARDEAEAPPAAPLAPVPCPECGEEPCWLVQLFGEEIR